MHALSARSAHAPLNTLPPCLAPHHATSDRERWSLQTSGARAAGLKARTARPQAGVSSSSPIQKNSCKISAVRRFRIAVLNSLTPTRLYSALNTSNAPLGSAFPQAHCNSVPRQRCANVYCTSLRFAWEPFAWSGHTCSLLHHIGERHNIINKQATLCAK